MVIVDEAHHARVRISGKRREETRLYKVVRELASPDAFSKRAALFLTATPMQLESRELYSLIEILDPALFPTAEQFELHRMRVPGLSRLVHELTEHGFPLPEGDPHVVVEQVAAWLDRDVVEVEQRLCAGPDSVARVCADLSARHLLSEVLIRNRKKIVGGFTLRHAHRWEVRLSPAERSALEAVEMFVRDGYARADSEPFPSCLCRANFQSVDGLGELSGAPGAAAELTENPPVLELRVRALAGCAEPRVGPVRFFLGFRLVLPAVRDLRVAASLVALIRQGDQPGGLQLGQHAPDPLGLLIVHRARSAPDTHKMSPTGLAMTCRFIPCFLCLPE